MSLDALFNLDWDRIGEVASTWSGPGLFVVAFATSIIATRTLRQAKADSIARTRPYLSVRADVSLAGVPHYDLVIENFGQSAATNIDVAIATDEDDFEDSDFTERTRKSLGSLKTLAPGERFRVYWQIRDYENFAKATDGFPNVTTVTVAYKFQGSRAYLNEVTEIDLGRFSNAPRAPQRFSGMGATSVQVIDRVANHIVAAIRDLRR